MRSATTCRIDGELTIYRAAELREALKAALADTAAGGALDVDLSQVTEMDSAGVQLLMAARKSACASARTLRLASPSAAVVEVLQTLRLDAYFAVLSPAPTR